LQISLPSSSRSIAMPELILKIQFFHRLDKVAQNNPSYYVIKGVK
jgi:hypothetical protein